MKKNIIYTLTTKQAAEAIWEWLKKNNPDDHSLFTATGAKVGVYITGSKITEVSLQIDVTHDQKPEV